jgi:hypothetical protein
MNHTEFDLNQPSTFAAATCSQADVCRRATAY